MKRIMAFIIVAVLIFGSIGGAYLYISRNNEDRNDTYMDEQVNFPQKDIVNSEADSVISESDLIRMDSQNGLDVAVVLNNILEDDEDNLVFKLMLNNHSINLDDIDFSQLTSIKNDSGVVIEEGIRWELSGGGGHHISGFLKAPKIYSGQTIINDNTEYIELEIKNLGGVASRIFRWDRDVLELYN